MKLKWKKKAAAFLVCQGISLFGSSVTSFALIWFVTLSTSSGRWVSALTVCSFLPQMFISFVSGAWADRHSKKRLIIGADAAIAFVTLLLAAAIHAVFTAEQAAGLSGAASGSMTAIPFVLILAAAALRSLGTGIQTPAVGAVIPEIVPENSLMRFNGINAAIQSIVQFAAPAAAGAVLSFGSLETALYIDIATAVTGIGILACIKLPRNSKQTERTENAAEASDTAGKVNAGKQGETAGVKMPVPVIEDIKSGLRYARSNRNIGLILAVYGAFIFLSVPGGFQSGLFTVRTFGTTYWYLTAVEVIGFAGMAAGGFIIGAWGGFKNRWTTLAAGLGAFGLLSAGMGLAPNFIVYLTLMLALGIALTIFQTTSTTILQEKTAPEMQGRMFGFLNIMYSGCLSLGMAVFGPLADKVSMRITMTASGALIVLLIPIFRLRKKL